MPEGQSIRLLSDALPREMAETLAAALGEGGWPLVVAVSAFEARQGGGWRVEVFCQADVPMQKALAQVHELAELAGLQDVAFNPAPLPDVDWVAQVQRQLAPVRAGRFFVHGSHDRHLRRGNAVNIEIDAARAFGTGHHGTTRGCLLALDWLLRRRLLRPSRCRPAQVLDVGTGTGVLGIAAARALKARVMATDIDAVSVVTAQANARANGAPAMRLAVAAGTRHGLVRRMGGGERSRRMQVSPREGLAQVQRVLAASRVPLLEHSRWRVLKARRLPAARRVGYDLVFANILARPLMRMAGELAQALRPGGWLVLSGLLVEQERMVLAVFQRRGLQLVRRWRLEGWSTLLLQHCVGQRGRAACTGR